MLVVKMTISRGRQNCGLQHRIYRSIYNYSRNLTHSVTMKYPKYPVLYYVPTYLMQLAGPRRSRFLRQRDVTSVSSCKYHGTAQNIVNIDNIGTEADITEKCRHTCREYRFSRHIGNEK